MVLCNTGIESLRETMMNVVSGTLKLQKRCNCYKPTHGNICTESHIKFGPNSILSSFTIRNGDNSHGRHFEMVPLTFCIRLDFSLQFPQWIKIIRS